MSSRLDPHVIVDFERVLDRLNARAAENSIVPSLDRISALVELLGDPHRAYDVVHVAGTNGKTTTSRMIESLLAATGLHIGLTTSPHLHDVRERIRIHGQSIGMETFIELCDEIEVIAELVEARDDSAKISYFEFLTAVAFAAFAAAPVDAAVIEVGLGGDWDSTNVVQPTVSVITPIGLDHMDMLGDTIEEIAAVKAGIIKPNSIVVVGKQDPRALEVILNRAAEVGAAALVAERDFGIIDRQLAVGGQVVTLRGLGGIYEDLVIPLHGQHQAENASLALAAAEAFFGAGVDGKRLDDDVVRDGLGAVTSPGRLEVIRRGPTVLVDVAHNPHGMQSLVSAINEEFAFTHVVVILGVFADKDVAGIVDVIEPIASHVIATQSSSPRAMPAAELGALIAEVCTSAHTETQVSLADALARAIEIADDLGAAEDGGVGILVTGSVVTVAQARALLGKRS